jgi:hypothetical protein
MMDGMYTAESLGAALDRAGRTEANRHAVVALIKGADTRWWGGNIDEWHPDETLLSSQSSLDGYRKLLNEFRGGRMPKAHAVMVYKDGTFAAVMLGIKTKVEADEFLTETMGIVRIRSAHAWLKA